MAADDMYLEATDRRRSAETFRRTHPTLRVSAPEITARPGAWHLTWSAELTDGPRFESSATIDADTAGEPPHALAAVLAVVDALSYWKAAVPSRLVADFAVPGDAAWWRRFLGGAMSEFLWTNGLDPSWLPHLDCEHSGRLVLAAASGADRALVLHSGGKDSITATELLHRAGRAVRPITYQPTDAARRVVEHAAPPGGWAGAPVEIHRRLDPAILTLNDAGYLNGHTPYSAWLAVAALVAADSFGIGRVAAGNSASDDGANLVDTFDGAPWPVNHQWTKSAEFEQAWVELCGERGRYASPLRPLYELGVIAGLLEHDLPGWSEALSCNRAAKAGAPGTWCGRCPKCVWTALAIRAIDGPAAVTARLGSNPLDDATNAPLVEAMAGRGPAVPFECAGLPDEVRACITAIDAAGARPAALHAYDGPAGAPLADVVGHVGDAPQLDDDERAAARAWAASAAHRLV